MTFFENELKRIMSKAAILKNQKFVGNACLARLTDHITVKVAFVAPKVADHYSALRISIINRTQATIDTHTLVIDDIIGHKAYIWGYRDEVDWYQYKPSAADYRKIAGAINDYCENFAD